MLISDDLGGVRWDQTPPEITIPVLLSDFPIPRTSFFLIFTMLTNLPSNLNFQGSSDFQRPSLFVKFVPSNFQSWPRNCPSQVICTYCWYCIQSYCKTPRFFSRGKISVNESYEIMHNFAVNNKTRIYVSFLILLYCDQSYNPMYYKHLKKGAHQSHFGRQKWAGVWQISLYIK